ncbi:MAG: hypothetical protein U0Q03_10055 [Acidimicrobiales bacterium]
MSITTSDQLVRLATDALAACGAPALHQGGPHLARSPITGGPLGEVAGTAAPDEAVGRATEAFAAWRTTPAPRTIDGRFYGLVGRQRLASVHYCYDDPDGCWQHEFVMVTTDDGVEWSDVVVPELDDMRLGSQTTLWTRPDGTILVTAADDSTGGVRLLEWTGASPPPTVDPAPYEPPDRSVPLVDPSASMSVGQVGRYPLGLGGCAGMYLDGRAWEPEVPLPDPPPPTWPVRDVQIADGPTAYVFGTVTKTADDTVEFSVADVGTVAVFHPRTAEPEYACG